MKRHSGLAAIALLCPAAAPHRTAPQVAPPPIPAALRSWATGEPARQEPRRFSLVIAETSRQDDPRAAPCGLDGTCGDSFYRASFHGTRRVAGDALPPAFEARLRLHSPLIARTTLALIVERKPEGYWLVLRRAGFNARTGIACFREPDEQNVDWRPEAPQIRWDAGALCVSDPRQIDPHAPRD